MKECYLHFPVVYPSDNKPKTLYCYGAVVIGDGLIATRQWEVLGADFDSAWLRQHTIDTINKHLEYNPTHTFAGQLSHIKTGIVRAIAFHEANNPTDSRPIAVAMLRRAAAVLETI